MAKVTKTSTSSSSTSHSTSQSQSQSQSQSTSKKFLDEDLLNRILAGLTGQMTDEEISQYAENLLRPQLNAGLEAAQQQYESTELAKRQEIENLAANLSRSIDEQNAAYRKNMADVETAALARGMGRSSYTLQTMANQGNALSQAVRQLTDENARRQEQIQAQITQAAQQNAQTQGRLNTDYASNLASKVQELKEQQRKEYNQNYMTAVSGSMGSQTVGQESTTGSSVTDEKSSGKSSSTTTTGSGGSSTVKKTYKQ